MAWSTRKAAILELRTQMQDTGADQRYTDTELGAAVDAAVEDVSGARPFLFQPEVAVPADWLIRVDELITGGLYRDVVAVVWIVSADEPYTVVEDWSTFEEASEHYLIVPSSVMVGETLVVTIRAGYGFSVPYVAGASSGTADTNIPPEWRGHILQGAEGYALDIYGAREVGRFNVSPAMQQQTARAAQLKLRDFHQWLAALPYRHAGRQVVAWGLTAVDTRTSDHRGFD